MVTNVRINDGAWRPLRGAECDTTYVDTADGWRRQRTADNTADVDLARKLAEEAKKASA